MSSAFECFYTLPQIQDFGGSTRVQWLRDPRLQQHLRTYQQESSPDEAQLAYRLMQDLQRPNLPAPKALLVKNHWIAFLSRIGEQIARRVSQELIAVQHTAPSAALSLRDLLQLTLETTLKPDDFFKGFELERAQAHFWYASLKKYARTRLEGSLYDRLRTMEGLATFKRTDLGLAARSSEKRVLEALTFAGHSGPERDALILLWKCFQEVRQAGQFEVSNPTEAQYQFIADRYNTLANKPVRAPSGEAHFADLSTRFTAASVEKQLKQLGMAIRKFIDRPALSLDAPRFQSGEESQSYLDYLEDDRTLPSLDQLSQQQDQETAQTLKTFLQDILDRLSSDSQRIPFLLHGLDLIQSQIGTELGKDQATISRHYKKLLLQLLTQIADWSQTTLNVTVDTQLLEGMKGFLQEYLTDYYPTLVHQDLTQIATALETQILGLLSNLAEIQTGPAYPPPPDPTNDTDRDIPAPLQPIQQTLANQLTQRIQTRLALTLKPQGAAIDRIERLTQTHLIQMVKAV